MNNEIANSQLERFDERTQRVLALSMELCAIPGVSVPQSKTDFDALKQSADVVKRFAEESGLQVIEMPADAEHPYPYIMVTFNDEKPISSKTVALVGHIDVVPAQEESQFTPQIDEDMLVGRGTADMKTVVATQLVWMAEQQAKPKLKPPMIAMISLTEENGSTGTWNTKQAIAHLKSEFGGQIEFAIVGERTGEMEHMGKVEVGPICEANRGWRWYRAESSGGLVGKKTFEEFVNATKYGRTQVDQANNSPSSERMENQGNWRTSFTNPFMSIGADELGEGPQIGYSLTFETQGTAGHAAQVSSEKVSAAEELFDAMQRAIAEFGEENVKLLGVEIGQDGAYNTVTGGGKVELLINEDIQEIEFWLDQQNRFNGLKLKTSMKMWSGRHLEEKKSITGFDIRDIQEHAGIVDQWRDETRRHLSSVGVELQTVNEGAGWQCPADNPHFIKLQKAYEAVVGEPSPGLGKLHGNDGRFFDGNAVVWGQTGVSPHGKNEAHYIPSIGKYMEALDALGEMYLKEAVDKAMRANLFTGSGDCYGGC